MRVIAASRRHLGDEIDPPRADVRGVEREPSPLLGELVLDARMHAVRDLERHGHDAVDTPVGKRPRHPCQIEVASRRLPARFPHARRGHLGLYDRLALRQHALVRREPCGIGLRPHLRERLAALVEQPRTRRVLKLAAQLRAAPQHDRGRHLHQHRVELLARALELTARGREREVRAHPCTSSRPETASPVVVGPDRGPRPRLAPARRRTG